MVLEDSFLSFWRDGYKKGYWYLLVLAIYYFCLAPCTLWSRQKHSVLFDLLYGITVFFLFKIALFFFATSMKDYLSLSLCANLWIYFYGSHILRKYDMIPLLMEKKWVYTLCFCAYIPLLLLYDNGVIVRFGQSVAIAAIVSLLFLFRKREDNRTLLEKGLSYLGRHTLDIYIYHYFFLRIIHLDALGKWFINTHNYLLEIALLILLALAVSVACVLLGMIIRQSEALRLLVYGQIPDKTN